jgi:hypothetical protein
MIPTSSTQGDVETPRTVGKLVGALLPAGPKVADEAFDRDGPNFPDKIQRCCRISRLQISKGANKHENNIDILLSLMLLSFSNQANEKEAEANPVFQGLTLLLMSLSV